MPNSSLYQTEAPKRVIANGGKGVRFHQWNMFECCRVIDDFGPMALEYFIEKEFVAYTSENWHTWCADLLQQELNSKEALLGRIQYDEAFGAPHQHAGQNRTYRSCTSGQQNCFAGVHRSSAFLSLGPWASEKVVPRDAIRIEGHN